MTETAREEQERRKARSEAILAAENIRINPHLPVLEPEVMAVSRTPEEVVDRLLALTIVAGKGEGEDEIVAQVIAERDARRCFSPREIAFIDDPAPSEQDRTQFRWRYEAAWVMFWALRLDDDPDAPLGLSRDICDVSYLAGMVGNLPDAALADNGLQPIATLMDEADLIYRCHWATRQAQVDGTEPSGGLSGDIAMERHQALNWLTGLPEDTAWDEVGTDT